jgi:hypothetical protein
MERCKARQASLFEIRPPVAELPEFQRQKALLLLGSLLTEALSMTDESEDSGKSREGDHDKDYL